MIKTSFISIADALFSKTKKAAIGILFIQPDTTFHLRELARRANVTAAMMSKEMDTMVRSELITESRDGNRRLFKANQSSPIFNELASIAKKTSGISDIIKSSLLEISAIDFAFIFGSVARGEDRAISDVDVFIVGHCNYSDVLDACKISSDLIGRPVNPVIFTPDELDDRVKDENVFMSQVQKQPRIILIGDAHDIARALGES